MFRRTALIAILVFAAAFVPLVAESDSSFFTPRTSAFVFTPAAISNSASSAGQAAGDLHVRDMQEEKRPAERMEMVVTHAEIYAGPWEAEDAKAGAVDGIRLSMNTQIRQSIEYLHDLQVEVYRRQSGDTKQAWFAANEGPDITWDGQRLRLKFQPRAAEDDALDLDLSFDAAQKDWNGTFSRNGRERKVRLLRPGSLVAASNRLAGDWFAHAGTPNNFPYAPACIHFAEERNGKLAGWEDTKSAVVINGAMWNHYGQELAVENATPDSISFTVVAAMGNRISFAGAMSADGAQIEGHWATNGQPSPHSEVLVKSSGEGFSSVTPPSAKSEN